MEKKPWRLNSLFNRFDVTRIILRPQFFFFAVSDLLKKKCADFLCWTSWRWRLLHHQEGFAPGWKSSGGKWNITLISDPNSSLLRRVCPFDKHDCPCCLSNLSQFVLKALQGPEDPSGFMARIYEDATQYLSAPAFRDLHSSFSLALLFVSVVGFLLPSRGSLAAVWLNLW